MSDEQGGKSGAPKRDAGNSRALARVQGLREALAHSDPEDKDTRRALCLALAKALGLALSDSMRADQREQLEFEQADALFYGGQFHRAAELYEALGKLERAADCYRRAGSIAELEAVHERQDKARAQAQSSEEFEKKLDEAFATGRRNLVLQQCQSLLGDPQLRAQYPHMMTRLGTRQRDIRARTPSAGRAQLELQALESPSNRCLVDLFWQSRIVIGRSPGVQVCVADPSLSREHIALEIEASHPSSEEPAQIYVRDLGSRSGSFLDGDALPPEEAIPLFPEQAYSLGLGMQSSVEVWTLPNNQALLIQDPASSTHWFVLGSQGLPLLLPHCAPESSPLPLLPLQPLTLQRESTFGALQLHHHPHTAAFALTLSQRKIQAPEPLELLIQDKLSFVHQGQGWSLEICA